MRFPWMRRLTFERIAYPALFGTIFALLLILPLGTYLGREIEHPAPLTLISADHFIIFSMVDAAYGQGHYRYLPSYLNLGFEKTLTHITPGIVTLPALIASATGIPVYDALEFTYGMLFALLVIPFSMLFAPAQPLVRILALALLPLLFKRNFIYAIGAANYGFILGTFLLFAFILLYYTPALKRSLTMAILLAGLFISYPPQFFFALVFLLIACGIELFRAKNRWMALCALSRTYGTTALLVILLSSVYLIIFLVGSFTAVGLPAGGYAFRSGSAAAVNPYLLVSATHLPLPLLILICFGALVLLRTPFPHTGVLFLLLILSNLNYSSFLPTLEIRAFQYRFLWPITLSLFFGVAIFTLLKRLSAGRLSARTIHVIGIGICCLTAVALLSSTLPREEYRTRTITPDQYAAFQWLEQHSPTDAQVLFLYGDGYYQSSVALKRIHATLPPEEMLRLLRANFSDAEVTVTFPRESSAVMKVFNSSRIQSIAAVGAARLRAWSNRSICDFDYYLLDTSTVKQEQGADQLIDFNAQFAKRAAAQPALSTIYQNSQTLIFQNRQRGERCV